MSRTAFLFALAFAAAHFGRAVAAEKTPPPDVPEALKPLGAKIGPHYAFKGTTLSFKAEEPLTEDQWRAVEAAPVKFVSAGGKGLDDAAVARLARLPVEGLSIDGSGMTDKAFEAFRGNKTLRSLGLSHHLKLTGEGAAPLAGLALTSFSCGGTRFGDAGIPHVAAIRGLVSLKLNHSAVTDAGVAALKDHPALEVLMISPQMTPRVSDSALETIATLKALKELTINQTVLTYDGGLKRLKELPTLKRLYLTEVGLSAEDLAKLKSDLPGVDIRHTPAAADAVAKWQAQRARDAAKTKK